jgi:16S rRNA (cytosine1402-N4)-methyltransferase
VSTRVDAHIPVLLAEVLHWLRPHPGGLYVDATVGYGGHAAAILAACGPDGRLIGIDRDPVAIESSRQRLQPFGERVRILRGNFAELGDLLADTRPDGVLFDVGVSSVQLDDAERGFSYRADAPLDMRMDPTQGRTAADLVNGLSRAELTRIIGTYGEERWAKRIAEFIVRGRPVATTGDLVEIIRAAVPAGARRGPTHPARRTFQALRIAVNGELEALQAGLQAAAAALLPAGRIVAISFHSLEDRIVKNTFRALATSGSEAGFTFTVLTRKPVRPGPDEASANPRARSAHLRALGKEAC